MDAIETLAPAIWSGLRPTASNTLPANDAPAARSVAKDRRFRRRAPRCTLIEQEPRDEPDHPAAFLKSPARGPDRDNPRSRCRRPSPSRHRQGPARRLRHSTGSLAASPVEEPKRSDRRAGAGGRRRRGRRHRRRPSRPWARLCGVRCVPPADAGLGVRSRGVLHIGSAALAFAGPKPSPSGRGGTGRPVRPAGNDRARHGHAPPRSAMRFARPALGDAVQYRRRWVIPSVLLSRLSGETGSRPPTAAARASPASRSEIENLPVRWIITVLLGDLGTATAAVDILPGKAPGRSWFS